MTKILLSTDKIGLRSDYRDKDTIRGIPGRQWNSKTKLWEFPLRREYLNNILQTFPGAWVDPIIEQAINQVEQREEMVSKAKLTGWENAQAEKPMPLKTTPFQHQIMGFNVGIKLPASAMLMEMGTGKSLTAIAVMGRRFLDGEVKRVLIVAPSSVVPAWARENVGEFAVHADFPYDVRALTGPVAKRIEVLEGWDRDPEVLQVAVVNYEATWRMEDALLRWKPDMIVADESQRIKTPGARQSKCLQKLGRQVKYRMILTGTPVTQGPLDVYSQYRFLDPSIFGTSYVAFKNMYAIQGGPNNKMVVGYKNLPTLIQKAHRIAFRVTKAEALDLPEFIDKTLYCEFEPKAMQLYNMMRQQSVMELENEESIVAQNVLSKLLRLSQITGGFIAPEGGYPEMVSSAKFDLLRDTVNDILEAGKKVVVFARFVPEIEGICRFLGSINVDYGLIYGAVKNEQRGAEVERFQKDPKCRVFVAQIQTAGLGITLTAADTAIFYSMDYSYANYEQCLARIHRIGQTNKCLYIHLIVQNTVDEKILQILKQKKSMADVIVDGWREFF